VLSAIFVGVGVLLLVLRQRKLKRALIYRVFEGGVVRQTSTERTELRFADVARLLARVTVFTNSQTRYATIMLVSRAGAQWRFDQHALDNVDESLIGLLAQRTGLRVESF
jgi:hypothetical protein